MVLDARRDAGMWSKFNAGLDGSAWHLWSLHRQLDSLLPGRRSVELLGQSVGAILSSPAVLTKLRQGQDAEPWGMGDLDRPHAPPKG
jgi:hypothetical protein